MNRDAKKNVGLSGTSNRFCCQDHFNVSWENSLWSLRTNSQIEIDCLFTKIGNVTNGDEQEVTIVLTLLVIDY